VDDRRLGLAIRARRHRRGWRLVDLAAVAGVSATTCSELERGRAGEMTVHAVRAVADAVELPIGWDVGWRRQEIDRLLDHDHSALAARVLRRLERWDWQVRAEVSFNRYGDRGRLDLLAFHPVAGVLLVTEVKTLIVDGQDVLGALDVKARVGPVIARELGWSARAVVPALVVVAGTTNRRRLDQLGPLLGRYPVRGQGALAWLRRPVGTPSGLLLLTKLPDSARADARRAGRQRVRLGRSVPRSARGSSPA
jgi:transcriptional regulator with XRE-family HTH domain